MTSKERMMRALHREKPDRLPVTIHQWQGWHLEKYLGGVSALEACKLCGLDAALQYFEAMGQFWIPNAEQYAVSTPNWRDEMVVVSADPDHKVIHHTIHTPGGLLTYKTEADRKTTWITEYLIKRREDVALIDRYMPVAKLNKRSITQEYDALGDDGILRGWVWGDQAGCWQHACCLMDAQALILATFDDPEWVHTLLRALLRKKLQFIEESLKGATLDLIETGGGAGSDTVISPDLHRDFCLPYDRQMHDALHAVGLKSTYHTCGGMMHILDYILANGADASETLAPCGVGGNIVDRQKVQRTFRGKVAMIGGMDQFNVLTSGTPAQIRAETHDLFRTFGADGGYICAASDHFFDTPVEHLKAFAAAARECYYH